MYLFIFFFYISIQRASAELEDMKEGMKQLEEVQTDLAEFFCEDATSFKLDECYKSLNGFFSKFKKV